MTMKRLSSGLAAVAAFMLAAAALGEDGAQRGGYS